MLQAVAFDLDDTLYPEREFVAGGHRAAGAWARRKWGVDIAGDLKSRFERGERGDLFTPALRARGICAAAVEISALAQVFREHQPVLRPYPDARPALARLRARGLRLGVITDGYWQVQLRKWRALGLAGCFDAVVFSDEFGRPCWKPHARPYLELARRLDIEPARMGYAGDNPHKDFVGARALGMRTVRVRRADGLHAGVRLDAAHEADAEFSDLTPAAGWLMEI